MLSGTITNLTLERFYRSVRVCETVLDVSLRKFQIRKIKDEEELDMDYLKNGRRFPCRRSGKTCLSAWHHDGASDIHIENREKKYLCERQSRRSSPK